MVSTSPSRRAWHDDSQGGQRVIHPNALGRREIDAEVVQQTLGSVLKYREDIEAVQDETLSRLVEEARAASAAR